MANQEEFDRVSNEKVSATAVTGSTMGIRNSSPDPRKGAEEEEEENMGEVELVGVVPRKSEIETGNLSVYNLSITSRGVNLKSPDLEKLRYLNYIEYWRPGGWLRFQPHNKEKKTG